MVLNGKRQTLIQRTVNAAMQEVIHSNLYEKQYWKKNESAPSHVEMGHHTRILADRFWPAGHPCQSLHHKYDYFN